MNIGIYVRPWNKKFYEELGQKVFGENSNFTTVSEFKNEGNIWLGEALKSKESISDFFTIEEMLDIYIRCRFLRSLNINTGFELISKMANQIDELLKAKNFDYFFGHLIDNYTLDIIERLCKKRGVVYFSLVGHFINGYSRISIRGEYNNVRENIYQSEINEVLSNVLDVQYKPSFDINEKQNNYQVLRGYLKNNAKRIFFWCRKKLAKDDYNYHYNTFDVNNNTLQDIFSKQFDDYFMGIQEVNNVQNTVYLPLHYTPEATVDYWCEDSQKAFYLESIVDLIEKSDKEINFIIKEHPAMYKKRDLNFYKILNQFDNVLLIHPYENSNELLNNVDNVLVYTGSVGVEALLRGKRVFATTENYYSKLHPNIKIIDYLKLEDLRNEILSTDNNDFLQELLKGLIPAKFINNRKIDTSDIENLALYLKLYLFK